MKYLVKVKNYLCHGFAFHGHGQFQLGTPEPSGQYGHT